MSAGTMEYDAFDYTGSCVLVLGRGAARACMTWCGVRAISCYVFRWRVR